MENKDQKQVQIIPEAVTEIDPPMVDEKSAEAQVSRRRALIAGLAAAPVVFTMFSRSAYATTTNCSVAQSVLANTSLHPGVTKDAAENYNNCRRPL